jgi:hypothetical protein
MRVAMAGEVLHAAGHAFLQRAAHPRGGQAAHLDRVVGEAALADDRVGRVVVDVQHRREVPVDAERLQAARDGRAHGLGAVRVAAGAQRHRRWRLGQEGHPYHGAALLVDADQRFGAEHVDEVGHQRLDLVFAADVLAEQADGTDLLLAQEGGSLGVERLARDVDHHEAAGVEGAHGSCLSVFW